MENLILASSSVFRQAQLKQLHIPFTSLSPDVDEDQVKNSALSPLEISRSLSLLKAQAIAKLHPQAVVIGADQVLNFSGEILSKPKTQENAIKQLLKLQGKEHQLITSYALVKNEHEYIDSVISVMKMKKLTLAQIEKYVEIDQPLHSCGSYKLETLGVALFDEINCPDHSAIIGLPLMSLTKALAQFGIAVL